MLTVEARVDIYCEAVMYITNYEESSEVTNAFVNREAITEALDSGEPLAPDLREALAVADDTLLAVRPILIRRFPLVFMDRKDVPTTFWWWHIGIGPHSWDRTTLGMNAPHCTAEQLVDSYRCLVTLGIPDDHNTEIDVLLALIARDVIEDRYAELSPVQQSQVTEIDRQFVAQHERTTWVLPTTSSLTSAQERWWWHLHEGPQVAPQELRP